MNLNKVDNRRSNINKMMKFLLMKVVEDVHSTTLRNQVGIRSYLIRTCLCRNVHFSLMFY
jgi:hypothetical protein